MRVNPRLIIDSISAHKLEPNDIDELLAEAEKKHLRNDLCGVKIKLFELKKDYCRAFTEHLNHPDHIKYVFSWLMDTLDLLRNEEIEWKRMHGFQIIEEEDEEDDSKDSDDESSTGRNNSGIDTANAVKNVSQAFLNKNNNSMVMNQS